MKNTLFNNAYGILGLLPNSSQKNIAKRLKDCEKLLQIGNIPSFEFDFKIFKNLRNEKSIKLANENLSNISKNIIHSFFSIYANSESQFKILRKCKAEFTFDLGEFGESLKDKFENQSLDFISRKNLAIIGLLRLFRPIPFKEEGEDMARFCANVFFNILKSSNDIKMFEELFKNDNDANFKDELFDDLKDKLENELSVIFYELSNKQKNDKIFYIFVRKFGTKNLNENIGKESYEKIQKVIKALEDLKISSNSGFGDNKKKIFEDSMVILKMAFDKLYDLGLYESSKSLQIRDLVAKKMRRLMLDLHNKAQKTKDALIVNKIAIEIAGTKTLQNELSQMLKNLEKQTELADIIPLIEAINETIDELEYNISDNNINKIREKYQKLQKAINKLSNSAKAELRLGSDRDIFDAFAIKIVNISINPLKRGDFYNVRSLLNLALEIANTNKHKSEIRRILNALPGGGGLSPCYSSSHNSSNSYSGSSASSISYRNSDGEFPWWGWVVGFFVIVALINACGG